VLLAASLLLAAPAAEAADVTCSAAGMAVDPVFCRGGAPSLLDRRIDFLRAVAKRVMDIAAFDLMLEDDKGALAIIREQCALEPDEGARRACHAGVLIDRLYDIEARIAAQLEARLGEPVLAVGTVPAPDGDSLTTFLAAIEAMQPAAVFADADGAHEIGQVAVGEPAVVTGVLLREAQPSLFRILWQHGTVAWTPADAWRFDPAQLIGGARNLPPSYRLAQLSQQARLACIGAALAALAPEAGGNLFGPWPAADGSFYARLEFPDAARVDCVAAPGPAGAVAIALTDAP
jgi:hypothetical protein